jgi:uncharacterized protein YfiM (DUF2279 family)
MDLYSVAKEQHREVEIRRWGKFELLDALMREDDASIRLRFWFDAHLLHERWFHDQVRAAADAAGPRYTPMLSLDTPVNDDLEAFGRTRQWQKALRKRAQEVQKQLKRWDDCCRRGEPFSGEPDELPHAAKEATQELSSALRGLLKAFEEFGIDAEALPRVRDTARRALELAQACVPALISALEAKHGAGVADSPGFRQFQAEYQLSFPARYVDAGREIVSTLVSLDSWLACGAAELPFASAMLMTGTAGMGKTHTICDVAGRRIEDGLRSVVLLGEWFSHTTGEAWQRIASSLGFASLSREDLFSLLDVAGEISGSPCILFIDALNETVPRGFWHDSLAPLVANLSKYQWLRLCVSCRSSYIEEVIPPSVSLPIVRHTGFEGMEYEACFEFFRHYGLDPPTMPLMQPEFGSPLFLRLVCEALHDSGSTTMPEGFLGLREVVTFLLRAKNKKLAKELDYDPREERVQTAVFAFVRAAAEGQTRSLEWSDAKKIIDAPWPTHERTHSLFDRLIREGVLREERSGVGTNVRDEVGVAFERLGDILIVEAWLGDTSVSDLKSRLLPGGRLRDVMDSSRGIAEALAIAIPERFGEELPDFIGSTESALVGALLDSLVWRTSSSITDRTLAFVRDSFEDRHTYNAAVEAILALATRADHPLNADWFHLFVMPLPLPARDGWLCPYLHRMYEERGGVSKLLRWALEANLDAVSEETARLWGSMLTWFCLASDRRVRDHATKAITRLMERRPTIIVPLTRRFSAVNDDYVIERCVCAAYGALLRLQDRATTASVAAVVHELFFGGDVPSNVTIRDHARSILELAHRDKLLPPTIQPATFRPPYRSEWPLPWPEPSAVAPFKDSYRELPKLYRSCFEDDFAHYTVRAGISNLRGIDEDKVLRWIFMHVLELGYETPQIVNFDRYILTKFGGGRAHPVWAERIGKKYQWISFYRLLGHVKDHMKPKRNPWDQPRKSVPPLQALSQRNIDPSLLLRAEAAERELAWWAPVRYNFAAETNRSDSDWLDVPDFPDLAGMLVVTNPHTGRECYVLQAYLDWSSLAEETQDRYPYRHIYFQIRSNFVAQRNAGRAWNWLKGKSFMGRWMPEGHDIHHGFLGEYPNGLPFSDAFSDEGGSRRTGLPCRMYPSVYTLNCSHGFDAFGSGFNVFVPSPRLLRSGAARWNGVDGYAVAGIEVMWDASIREEGPQAFVIDAEYLRRFLAERRLAIVWTGLSEKQVITGGASLGWIEYSNIARLRGGKVQMGKRVVKRVGQGDAAD